MAPNADVTKLIETSRLLAEMPSKTRQKVLSLTKWIKEDMGAPLATLGDEFEVSSALRILQLHKMNVHKAQRHFIKHYKLRSSDGCPEIFHDRIAESEEILTNCQNVYMLSIPRLTIDDHRINYIKLSPGATLENFDPRATFKRFFMVSDIRFKEDAECKGDVFLIDLTGFTYSHALKLFNSGLLNKFIKCLKDTYPRKLVAIHFINAKCWHKKAISLSLKMSKAGKKIYKKIGTHGEESKTIEGLETSTDRAFQMFHDHNDLWTKKLISYSAWFEQQESSHKAFVPRKLKKSNYDLKKYEKSEKSNDLNHPEVFTFLELDGAFRQIELDENDQR